MYVKLVNLAFREVAAFNLEVDCEAMPFEAELVLRIATPSGNSLRIGFNRPLSSHYLRERETAQAAARRLMADASLEIRRVQETVLLTLVLPEAGEFHGGEVLKKLAPLYLPIERMPLPPPVSKAERKKMDAKRSAEWARSKHERRSRRKSKRAKKDADDKRPVPR